MDTVKNIGITALIVLGTLFVWRKLIVPNFHSLANVVGF